MRKSKVNENDRPTSEIEIRVQTAKISKKPKAKKWSVYSPKTLLQRMRKLQNQKAEMAPQNFERRDSATMDHFRIDIEYIDTINQRKQTTSDKYVHNTL